jgi:hypothetical protein
MRTNLFWTLIIVSLIAIFMGLFFMTYLLIKTEDTEFVRRQINTCIINQLDNNKSIEEATIFCKKRQEIINKFNLN